MSRWIAVLFNSALSRRRGKFSDSTHSATKGTSTILTGSSPGSRHYGQVYPRSPGAKGWTMIGGKGDKKRWKEGMSRDIEVIWAMPKYFCINLKGVSLSTLIRFHSYVENFCQQIQNLFFRLLINHELKFQNTFSTFHLNQIADSLLASNSTLYAHLWSDTTLFQNHQLKIIFSRVMCFCRAFIGWRGSLRRPAWFAGPQLEQAFTMAPSPATPVEPSSGYLLFLLTRKMFCFFKFKEVTFMNHKTIHPSTCSTTVLH